jgi:PAS domain S-box-containing protein
MKYFKNIIIFLILLNFFGILNAGTQNKIPTVKNTIYTASEPDYPPFCIVNKNGEADGFSVDLLKEVAITMNLQLKFKVDTWDKIKKELAEGKIDVLPMVGRSDEREAIYDFTFPYHILQGKIFVRKGTVGVKTLKDLKDKEIIVMKGDNAEEYVLRENLSPNIIITKNYKEAFRLLNSGKHDVVIAQRLMGLQLLNEMGISKIVPLHIQLNHFNQSFCFAVQEGNNALLAKLNEGLSIIIANGTYEKLHQKWFTPEMQETFTFREKVKMLSYILVPVIILLFFLLIVILHFEVKRKTKELKNSETRLKKAQLLAKVGNWEVDIETGLLWASEEARDIYKVANRPLTLEIIKQFPLLKYRAGLDLALKELLAGGIYEQKFEIRPDNTEDILWISSNAEVLRDDKGKPIKVIGVMQDITQSRIVEEKLKESENLLIESQEVAKIGSYDLDISKGIWVGSSALNDIFGIDDSNDHTLDFWMSMIHPDCKKEIVDYLMAGFKKGGKLDKDYKIIRQDDGMERWVHGMGKIDVDNKGKAIRMIGTIQDITERKRTEEELEKNEEMFRIIFEASTDGIILAGAEDKKFYIVNKKIEEITGYSLQELRKMKVLDIHPEKDLNYVIEQFEKQVQGKIELAAELPVKRKNGSVIYCDIKSVPISLGGKKFLLGIFNNVTERKKAERDRDKLMLAIEQIEEGIVVTDDKGDIEYVNQAFEKMTGYSSAEVLGKNPNLLRSDKQGDDHFKKMWDIISGGETWAGRFINKKKNGDLYTEDAVISPVINVSGKTVNYVAVKRDITAKLELQEQLRQTQKMESIGILAGGVAHDFNNILTSIIGDTDLLLTDCDRPAAKPGLQSIKKSSLRASELVKQLLTFSRKQPVTMKALNINTVIDDMYKMIFRLLGENISIKTDLCEENCSIKADKGNIEQILINLAVNARDAMPDGGSIFFRTKKIMINADNALQFGNVKPGEYVELRVEDTGEGMTKEVKEKIFDPFFTTKEEGKGTGLGLSVLFGIIKVHNGGINVYSAPGKGTRFAMYFPISQKLEVKPEKNKETILNHEGHGERILVVEDEEAIQKVAKRMLLRKNYKPIIAGTVREAVEIYKNEKGEFDLVFSDMILPDGTGLDVIKQLNDIKPVKKILLSSGYLDDKSRWEDITQKEIPFIGKPYGVDSLTQKITEVLNS